jgi:hypothetical protein
MSLNKEIIELVNKVISDYDPVPSIVNDNFPIRWESNIFLEDYDFSENILELNQETESSDSQYLKSIATAIEISRNVDGGFNYKDGIFLTESHSWCSRLNNNPAFPSFSLINEDFKSIDELNYFLVNKI